MGKETFVFSTKWREILSEYPAEVKYEVYDAIIEYAASGTLMELKPLAKMAFSFIKREMDFNEKRWEDKIEARREAGKKGMENRWKNKDHAITKITSDNKDNNVINAITKITSDNKDNIYVNEYEYENVNVNENVNEYENEYEETFSDKPKITTPTPQEYEEFSTWLKENATYCDTKLKPITQEKYYRLRKDFTIKEIAEVILQLENRVDKRKTYSDLYLTVLNWLKFRREKQKTQ